MDEILFWGLSISAWITLATDVTVMGVLLLTKIRTDAVSCLTFPLTPLP